MRKTLTPTLSHGEREKRNKSKIQNKISSCSFVCFVVIVLCVFEVQFLQGSISGIVFSMKLDVVQSSRPWYAEGLHFQCTQCGNCCTGGPGFVWISGEEIRRLAGFLEITVPDVVDRYCRTMEGRFSLNERRNAEGEYDCIFLKTEKGRRSCTIYPVRPLQCRTWPFWAGLLANPDAWNHAAVRCSGINRGDRKYSREKIESLRDARDWPGEGESGE
jgi:uncharacterized protein